MKVTKKQYEWAIDNIDKEHEQVKRLKSIVGKLENNCIKELVKIKHQEFNDGVKWEWSLNQIKKITHEINILMETLDIFGDMAYSLGCKYQEIKRLYECRKSTIESYKEQTKKGT